jgi:HlyD family secretion protein
MVAGAGWAWRDGGGSRMRPVPADTKPRDAVPPHEITHTLRLDGLIEAAVSVPVLAPELAGLSADQIVITRLAPNGIRVRQGDLLVEFDRQAQDRSADDKRAEWQDLVAQIDKKRAELSEQDAKDLTAVDKAESDAALARLETSKNEMLPRIDRDKNQLAWETATATRGYLRESLARKHAASDLAIRILEVRAEQLASVARQAARNAARMTVQSPIAGLVVYRPQWRTGQFRDPETGLEVWPGTAVLDVELIDPGADS